MPESDDSLPRFLSGRYRLESTLGSGGMGVVYRATDLTMHRAVAVKLIRASEGIELDEEVAGRFHREAKNTARVQHEHIIEVYDLGRSEQGDLYFVMELLEGESLSTRLRREGKLSAEATIHIGRQICEALHVAHSAGVIHRDLKPANVMLVHRAGDDDFVKVLDFGVAKSYSPDQQTQLTHTGMLVGTIEYMAPEQIMGKTVDGRTDIYALGVVLYRMLAGKAPFRDGGVPALIHAHLNVMPKPLIEVVPDVPGALDRIVLRCMAKRPEQRFESMSELSRALTSVFAPDDLGLVSLEYGSSGAFDDDPYAVGDQTEVARPALADEEGFDDATVKMDRFRRPSAESKPMAPAPAPMLNPLFDETHVMVNREELSTAKRPIPDEITRIDRAEAKTCAMCQTVNAPHARACIACGVSLAADDQAAVRARVSQPPRPARASVPPSSAPQVYPPGPRPSAPFGPSHVQGVQGMHQMWTPSQPPPSQRPAPSMWERFLNWTGLGVKR
jgi:serine/threonine protein kinase